MFRFSFRKMVLLCGAILLFSEAHAGALADFIKGRSDSLNICWSLGKNVDEAQAHWGLDLVHQEGVNRVRVYDSVPKPSRFLQIAKERGVRVTMGAWLDKNPEENAEQLQLLHQAIKDNLVEPVAIIGNESVQYKFLTPDKLVEHIEEAKRVLPEHVAVTAAESDEVLIKYPELIAAQRHIVGLIYYPFAHWKHIDEALKDFVEKYQTIKALSGNKRVVVYETGWPSSGKPYGKAVPSVENQKRYNREVAEWAHANDVEVYFFSIVDESWKADFSDDDHKHEAHWGIRREDGSPKH